MKSLKGFTTSGIRWSSLSQFGRQAMQLVTTAILARLLDPADFGLIGMATIVIGFVSIFRDLGTSSAVIQRKHITEDLLSSIFWVNVVFGLVAAIFLYLISPCIASFYHEPMVDPLLQLLSLTFLISGLSSLQKAILEREMAFNKLAMLEIMATFSGAVVGIGAAFMGYGVWSLALQALAVTSVTTILLWTVSRWSPKAVLSWPEIKSVMNYSLNLTGFSIFNYFVRNADYLLIGKFLGARDLGFYTLAYRIMLYPLQSITSVLARAMFPAFSQIQDDDERFRRIYLKMVWSIALITFPMMLGLIVLAEPFVLVIFGQSWRPVSLLLIILAPVGMLQSVAASVGVIYQAKGRTDMMFRWGLVTGVISVFVFYLGLRWGITGVALSYAILSLFLIYPNFSIPFKLINLPVAVLGKMLALPFMCSMVMLTAVLGIKMLLLERAPDDMQLVILVPLGIAVYMLATWSLNRDQFKQALDTIKAKA